MGILKSFKISQDFKLFMKQTKPYKTSKNSEDNTLIQTNQLKISGVTLPSPKQQSTGECTVTGWGTLSAGGQTPDVLMKVSVFWDQVKQGMPIPSLLLVEILASSAELVQCFLKKKRNLDLKTQNLFSVTILFSYPKITKRTKLK